MLRALSALLLWLAASAAFAQAPPPIPPIADADRVQTYNIISSTPQVQVNFPVFGDCTDLTVTIAGVSYPTSSGLWNCASASGFALNTLPLPITDMVVNFTPALTSGTLTIVGAWHPRNLTVPTAPGISRREYEQAVSTLIAAQRELFTSNAALFAAGVTPIGPALDTQFGSTQGSIFYRGATTWSLLTPGTVGQVLQTGGAAANPSWRTITGTGTVTNITAGTGLSGGAITTTGTIALASASNNTIKSNVSGGSAVPVDNTPSAVFDAVFGSTQGNIVYRGAATWAALAHGTAGQFLQSGGAAANPSWTNATTGPPTAIALGGVFSSTAGTGLVATGIDTSGNVIYGAAPYGAIAPGTVLSNNTGGSAVPIGNSESSIWDNAFGSNQGMMVYRGSAAWQALTPGTAGQVLTSGGASANLSWSTVTGTGTVTSIATGTGLTGGTITGAGTISLANAANLTIKSNISGGAAAPVDNSLSAMLDGTLGNARGSIIYRGAANWQLLGPGSSGQGLVTKGAAADPSWIQPATTSTNGVAGRSTGTAGGIMMGIAGSITPTKSGNVLVVGNGSESPSNSNGCTVGMRYGTGTAPVNGAAATGTAIGIGEFLNPGVSLNSPFSAGGVVTGLSVGTTYWIDFIVTIGTSAVCTLNANNISAMEN